jgi:hypothetical protein
VKERGTCSEAEEDIIATSPTYAYLYAKDILKAPFPKGEKAISLNPRRSHRYAREVLESRFFLGEPSILTDATVAIQYASEVIHHRMIEAEPLIVSKFGQKPFEQLTDFDKLYLETYFKLPLVDNVDSLLTILPTHLVSFYEECIHDNG